MKVFNCILGILTVLASIYCIFYPGLTFSDYGEFPQLFRMQLHATTVIIKKKL